MLSVDSDQPRKNHLDGCLPTHLHAFHLHSYTDYSNYAETSLPGYYTNVHMAIVALCENRGNGVLAHASGQNDPDTLLKSSTVIQLSGTIFAEPQLRYSQHSSGSC